MHDYLYYVVIMDCLVLLCMIFMVRHNDLLKRSQKQGFIISFIMIVILSIVELITVIVDGMPKEYRWINYFANLIGFIASPFIPVLFGNSISGSNKLEAKIAMGVLLTYSLFVLIQIPFGLIYTVDVNNVYHRGSLFFIFLIIYIAGKLYLVYTSAIMVKKFQNRNRIVIVLLLILFLTGSCIQIFKPDVHTSFSCITIIAIMYYTYFNDLWQQVDGMTGLFLHQAYIQRAARLKVNEAIIIMDCDDFKEINDTYGHQTGDECLITITNAIKSTYQNDGICYRIGGDEFAIILFKSELIGELNSTFLEKLSLERAKNPLLPFVSLGTAIYHEQDDPNQVRDIADKMMYQHKLRSKVVSDELENK